MGINKPIIPAGPTIQRAHITDYPVRTHDGLPGETYLKRDTDGINLLIVTVSPPTREGQVYFYRNNDGANRQATMYVGVDISGTLTWVRVSFGSFNNSYTGQAYDPIYG